MSAPDTRRYGSGTFEKGLDVLESLERASEPLRIHDIAQETGLDRAAVFRLLCTLENRGYIERFEDKRYRAKNRKRMPKISYLAPLSGNPFREEVTRSLQRAAADSGLQLELVDTGDVEFPREQIDAVLRSGAEAVILFQRRGSLAHLLADRFLQEQIPLISVETPIAGALYFGGNNYRAGLLAGEALGTFARRNWQGAYDKLVLLESSLSAAATMARLTGTVEGVGNTLGVDSSGRVVHVDGLASAETSREACLRVLKSLPRRSRVLISCFNDLSAMGAVQAARELDRINQIAIVGQNGTAEARAELVRTPSPLIATVAYFPERYGEELMRMATAVITHQKAPLAVYVDHVLLNRSNLKRYYPRVSAAASR